MPKSGYTKRRNSPATSIEPMLAVLGDLPKDMSDWAAEYKWDGVRALCYWDGTKMRIESRNLIHITARYPEFFNLGKALGKRPVILDGEIIALDKKGIPSFKELQKRMHVQGDKVAAAARQTKAYYQIFDVLFYNNEFLFEEPYEYRREILEKLKINHPHCDIPPSFPREGKTVLSRARKSGLEGIVCKRLDSFYYPGIRSRDWVKVKITKSQEFVIGGWIPSTKDSRHIRSILIGYYDKDKKLHYVGNVGTGFTEETQRILHQKLMKLRQARSPFAGQVPKKDVIMVAPKLVAEIEYRRWPKDSQVQQASFKGLREDKPAREITREKKE